MTTEATKSDFDAMIDFLPGTEVLRTANAATATAAAAETTETETTTDETEETTAAETETEETTDETTTEETPTKPSALLKRIDKLTARAKTAEERVAELERKLEAKPTTATATPATAEAPSVVESAETIDDLRKLHRTALDMKEWAYAHLDGGELTKADGTTEELSAEQVRRLLARADRLVAEEIPRRTQDLQARQVFSEQARELYPQYFAEDNDAAEEYAKVRTFLDQTGFGKLPDIELIAARYLAGVQAEQGRASKAQAAATTAAAPTKPKTAVAPMAPRPTAAPVKKATTSKADALARVADTAGSEESLMEYFQSV